jgi:hypothetical protein
MATEIPIHPTSPATALCMKFANATTEDALVI